MRRKPCRRHLLLAFAVACLGAAGVWVSRPAGVSRRVPGPSAAGASEEDAVAWRWAAALRRQDRLEIARSERDLVQRGEAAVSPLVRAAQESPELAEEVVRVLGLLRYPASVSALRQLHREHGATRGAALRVAVLRALAEIGGQTAREAFLALLRDEVDPSVQQTAAELAPTLLRPEDLASLPPDLLRRIQGGIVQREDVSKLLMELSKTPASGRTSAEWAAYLSPVCPLAARTIAIDRLEARADPEAIQALRNAARGDDLDTAVGAFGALCRLPTNEVRVAVKDLLLSAPEERLAAMLDVLGTYGDSAYVPLARQLRDRSGSERLKELADRAALRLKLR